MAAVPCGLNELHLGLMDNPAHVQPSGVADTDILRSVKKSFSGAWPNLVSWETPTWYETTDIWTSENGSACQQLTSRKTVLSRAVLMDACVMNSAAMNSQNVYVVGIAMSHALATSYGRSQQVPLNTTL